MSFVYAWFLWLLIPLVAYLWRREPKQSLQQNLRWLALGLLIIAIARPVIPQVPTKQNTPAHSLVMALDLSASMSAEDIKPNRQEASRATIKAFLKENVHDQVALMGFTINPLLLSPPTTDHALVSMALDSLKSEYILTKGTNLQKLLEKVAQFPDQEKLLILFSDGGDEVINEGLTTFAKEKHIQILAIAMATTQGSTISTKENRLLKDSEGHIVVSKFNPDIVTLAKQSGGAIIEFDGVSNTANKIQTWIEQQKALKHTIDREIQGYIELYHLPTLLALILLFLSATRFSLKVIALLALMGINIQADELVQNRGCFDSYHLGKAYLYYEQKEYNRTLEQLSKIETPTLESQLTLAHTYYQLEKYKQAKNILKSIKSTNPNIKQQLLYELGNCEAKLAYFDKAKNYYTQALQLGEDNDTLHNLKVVIFQQNIDSSKIGFTNPSSPEATSSSNNNAEAKEKASSKQEEQVGGSGGTGSTKSKTSTVKVIKSSDLSSSKKEMSSKAYDLINEGYIREEKPW
ncbi:MAG: VWA domain-containing protein [Epsilonproteobacteria bacterium]|nr:VWA domain-containing protein [Campylobacterota bacterium]